MADAWAGIGASSIPSSALSVGIVILVYSVFCLALGVLLLTVLFNSQDKSSYVFLFALSTTLSTTATCIQQIYDLAEWRAVRIGTYYGEIAADKNLSLAFGPFSTGFLSVLYWIANYLYNVDALLMLFWAVNLTVSVWTWRPKVIRPYFTIIGYTSKIFAVAVPALLIVLSATLTDHESFITTLFLFNLLFFISLTFGAICVLLILTKYLVSRLGLTKPSCINSATHSGGPGSFGITSTIGGGDSTQTQTRRQARVAVDSLLVLRFSVAFIILLAFQAFLIYFRIHRYHKAQHSVAEGQPDFTARSTINDQWNFIPPVSASPLAFFLFGTTVQHRKAYAEMFRTICCMSTRAIPSSRRLEGSSFQDWGRLGDRNATIVDNGIQTYELENGSMSNVPLKNETNIHITSEIMLTEENVQR